ncbi:MAG: dicarboxylate/amino acid:cation symporter, partial [Proteobacteria bacterium]|nr:dicarboxylate/amino acid:cation symporter [Pseudomonadota bacterium]
LGTIFLNALKMIIVPLIFSSILVGIAGIGRGKDLGRLGGKTIGFYLFTGLLAVLIGLAYVNLVQPGYENGEPVRDQLALEADKQDVKAELKGTGGLGELVDLFVRMVPENIVETASSNGDLLALIFFAILFGFFITRVGDEHAQPLYNFWNAVFNVMMKITEFIMRFAPIGVFGLVATVVAETGFDAVRPLGIFALTVVAALLTHALVTLPLMTWFIAGVNPWKLYRAISPALLTAFSTASSSGTLPITMDCIEKNVGVSNRTSSFVLPLGATVNMNGTALYECVAVMFLAQAYGIDLTFTTQFVIVLTALVTSIGVAGVPSASIVAIGMILTAVGLPLEAMGVLFVFDRVLDMMRTSVNVMGDGVCAVIVARLQGEENLLVGGDKEDRLEYQ